MPFNNGKQKYVKLSNNGFIFLPMFLDHSQFRGFNPVSAGFCNIHDKEIICYGESTSLHCKSDTDDSILATTQVFGYSAGENLREKLKQTNN